jgi:hypothetical protein
VHGSRLGVVALVVVAVACGHGAAAGDAGLKTPSRHAGVPGAGSPPVTVWRTVAVFGVRVVTRRFVCGNAEAGAIALCHAATELGQRRLGLSPACRFAASAVLPPSERRWVAHVTGRRGGKVIEQIQIRPADWCGQGRNVQRSLALASDFPASMFTVDAAAVQRLTASGFGSVSTKLRR